MSRHVSPERWADVAAGRGDAATLAEHVEHA
jgi:hypothetical protein